MVIRRLTEFHDAEGVLTHQMCCLCVEFIAVEDLWTDAEGQRWDLCSPCKGYELAELVIRDLRQEHFGG